MEYQSGRASLELSSSGKLSVWALAILRNAAATNGLDPMEVFPEGVTLIDKYAAETEVQSIFTLFTPEWRYMTLVGLASNGW